MAGTRGAVVADRVGEAVRAVVVGVRRIAHAAAREADRAVAGRPHRDHRQTSVERRRQVVGIGVVGQHVDGVVARVLATVACRPLRQAHR